MTRNKRFRSIWWCLACLTVLLTAQISAPAPGLCAGATTSVRVAKYAADGKTVLAARTVDYRWLEANLAVQGDGKTHFYHQGPVFEGDPWDPGETVNLKDKGAVKGTAVRDLCELVGGMSQGDEVALVAIDNWLATFGYRNIYEPVPEQGAITLCWYCGEQAIEGERFGTGYPAAEGYSSAMQIVFIGSKVSKDGRHVFGNNDMKLAMPQTEYQHFFEGQYPSTNGLSGKWISEVRVYTGGAPGDLDLAGSGADHASPQAGGLPGWLPPALGGMGVLLVLTYLRLRSKAL